MHLNLHTLTILWCHAGEMPCTCTCTCPTCTYISALLAVAQAAANPRRAVPAAVAEAVQDDPISKGITAAGNAVATVMAVAGTLLIIVLSVCTFLIAHAMKGLLANEA